MKTIPALTRLALGAALALTLAAPSLAGGPSDALYQASTLEALLAGVYDGPYTLARLAERGDLGLGTFNRLDGEMVVVDGVIYQVKSDGSVATPPPETGSPFANLARFEADQELTLEGPLTLKELEAKLEGLIANPNIFHAVRITGRFASVKTRSVPAQARPYPPLVEVVKHQSVFLLDQVEGDLLGFRFPKFAKGINVTGWHLHFLDQARQKGGHVLDAVLTSAKVRIDHLPALEMDLPQSGDFATQDLGQDRSGEIQRVEK